MTEFNIARLMNASPYINQISNETYDALFDFYVDTGATLENINVDNDIVNYIVESTLTEFNKYYDDEDDISILYKNEDEDFIAYWN